MLENLRERRVDFYNNYWRDEIRYRYYYYFLFREVKGLVKVNIIVREKIGLSILNV